MKVFFKKNNQQIRTILFIVLIFISVSIFKKQTAHATTQASGIDQEINYFHEQGYDFKKIPQISMEGTSDREGLFEEKTSSILIKKNLSSVGLKYALVHELTHYYRSEKIDINWCHQKGGWFEQFRWFEEGLAKFWQWKSGNIWFPVYDERFSRNPTIRLSNDSVFYTTDGDGYISSFYFIVYLYNHFGGEHLLQKMMDSKFSGWENILNAINELKSEGSLLIDDQWLTKESIVRFFSFSLYFNDPDAFENNFFELDKNFKPEKLNLKAESEPMVSDDVLIRFKDRITSLDIAENRESFCVNASKNISLADLQKKCKIYILIR